MPTQKNKPYCSILAIALSTPILIGIYDEQDKLVKSYELFDKASDALPKAFDELLKEYELKLLYYANGPGSAMGIKIVYICLKTLSIVKGVKLFGADGFNFNGAGAIPLGKNRAFVQKEGEVLAVTLDGSVKITAFKLPDVLDKTIFEESSLPNYILPAI